MNNLKLNIKNSSLFNIPQSTRVEKLNQLAIKQMNILLNDYSMKKLEKHEN